MTLWCDRKIYDRGSHQIVTQKEFAVGMMHPHSSLINFLSDTMGWVTKSGLTIVIIRLLGNDLVVNSMASLALSFFVKNRDSRYQPL